MEICFSSHPGFGKEFSKFERKAPLAKLALKHLKKLLSVQFHPKTPTIVISKQNLRRVDKIGEGTHVYKVFMAVRGLRRFQRPRIYFWLETNNICFLCMGTHMDNYDDAQLKKKAKKRIKELNPNVNLSRF